MCYNIYIMRKYLFLTAFVAAAVFLSGCQKDRTTTVIYTDVPSPLTQMTFRESLPPETYSEYMATYTPESETSSDRHRFTMIGGVGIYADTGVTAPPAGFGGGVGALKRDTAVTTVPVTETDEAEETVTCAPIESETDISETSSELAEQTEQTDISEPAKTSEARTLARPKADTGVSVRATRISADTSQTSSSSETETDETESSAE